MWDYQYASLDHEQQVWRRAQLDWAGYYVILSQVLVGVLVAIHRTASSPSWLRQLMWRLYNPISLRHPKLRCWGDWLVVAAWSVWCISLVSFNTGNDYFHLTKAFGAVAVANFPLHFMLAMKRSPLRWLFGLSYEGHANFMHRWLGRIINVLLYSHATLYLAFFWQTDRMTTRFLESDVLCGFSAICVLFAVGVSANHYIRHLSYRTFYLLHITLATLLFPLLYLHVSHLRLYLLPSILLFAADQALKYYLRIPALATISTPAPGLLQITATFPSPTPPTTTTPGSHALLRHAPTSFWTANPFTIVPSTNKQIRLIARIRNGFTRKLAALPTSRPVPITLDLPFGPTFGRLEGFDRILLIAAGVGATFAVGWMQQLVRERGAGKVRFVWAVRTPVEVAWALQDDTDIARCVELYITGAQTDLDGEQGVEMTEGLLSAAHGGVESLVQMGVARGRIASGRPHLSKMVGETVLQAGEGRTAVLVCGPAGMAQVVKRAVAKLGMEGKEVWFHVEEFGH